MSSSKGNGYIFRVKSEDGIALRVLSEYFANLLTFPPFHVNEKGIFVRAMNKRGEVLVDVQMPRSNFTVFKCAKSPLYFGVNATHFYRLLRPIKKKDMVSLFIREQLPMQLGICVELGDKPGDKVTTYIQINYIQPDEIELPEGYDENPIVETTKRFQRLKMLHTIGPEIWATVIDGKRIRFTVNGKNLFSREVILGESMDDEEDEENSSCYTLTYSTNQITQLTKCAGHGNVKIFQNEELPLLIQMQLESLATLSVYIKSRELIEQLEQSSENSSQMSGENGNQSSELSKSEKNASIPNTKNKKKARKDSSDDSEDEKDSSESTETNKSENEKNEDAQENEEDKEDKEENNDEDENDENNDNEEDDE